MELRHLRYFVAVAEELSFTRAAAREQISQPPLSQQVAKLERELGVRLLERNSRGVRLTRAGSVLLDEARVILGRVAEAERVVQRAGRGDWGSLRIGSVSSGFSGVLLRTLQEFRTRYPDVLPLVYEMEDTPQREALVHHRIDIGFLRSSNSSAGVDVTPIAAEALFAALPATHRLAGRPRVSLRDLREESFVLFPRASAPDAFDAIVSACADAGFSPDVVYEAPNDHTLVGIVAAQLAVSVVPESTSNLQLPGITYRALDPVPEPTVMAVATNSQGPSAPARRMLDLACELYRVEFHAGDGSPPERDGARTARPG